MHFPNKSNINKIIIVLVILAVLTLGANLLVKHFNQRFQTEYENQVCSDFLNYIESGDLNASMELWPAVYTYKTGDIDFLDSFSESLLIVHRNYYESQYINSLPAPDLYELSRIFNDYIYDEAFNSIADEIYDDYLNENITLGVFFDAENDLSSFARHSSAHVRNTIDSGLKLNQIRSTYYQAIEASYIPDYRNAIDLLKTISTFDSVYYPRALEKIDEFIESLRKEALQPSD